MSVGHPLKLLVIQRLPDGVNLSHRGARTARHLPDAEDAEGPDLEPGWVWIFRLHGRPDLPTESRFNNGLERGLPTDREGLGLHQEVIRKNEGCFHDMANNLGVRQPFKLGLSSPIHAQAVLE